ncbi:MAG: gliding motility-associated C-terminal domain-containing protein, partial [Bacteroidia bacterium]
TIQYRGSQPFNLQIFDRWGVQLHQTLNKESHWDGRNQDGQPVTDGVYFYNLNIGGKGYAGEVTLVR